VFYPKNYLPVAQSKRNGRRIGGCKRFGKAEKRRLDYRLAAVAQNNQKRFFVKNAVFQ
jgi:hypothetical protein